METATNPFCWIQETKPSKANRQQVTENLIQFPPIAERKRKLATAFKKPKKTFGSSEIGFPGKPG